MTLEHAAMRHDDDETGLHELRAAMARAEEATRQLVHRDPAPFLALLSASDDITLYPAEGGRLVARQDIAEGLAWLAGFVGSATLEFEYLAVHAGREMAYTVGVQRARFEDGRVAEVRVTHIYRREEGEFRLVHRHGDRNMELDPSILTRA